MRDVRTKYQAHVSAMLRLAKFSDTDVRAQRDYSFLKELIA